MSTDRGRGDESFAVWSLRHLPMDTSAIRPLRYRSAAGHAEEDNDRTTESDHVVIAEPPDLLA